MTFGEQIKQKREALGLTQEELAEKLDVSRQAISKWESDLSMPAGKNKSALCHLLGIEDEKQAVPHTMLRWLYGGWLAAAVCARRTCCDSDCWNQSRRGRRLNQQ